MKLFQRLLELLFETRVSESRVAKASDADLAELLRPAPLSDIPGISLCSYREPLVRALITEAKFHDSERAIALLGQVLASYLEEELAEHALIYKEPLIIVPIPLSKRRMKERGYNQVERVVESALSHITSPHARISYLLTRVRDTTPQTTLPRTARLTNIVGAFKAKELLGDERILLIDDVATTGATLKEAKETLERAGAKEINVLTLSH